VTLRSKNGKSAIYRFFFIYFFFFSFLFFSPFLLSLYRRGYITISVDITSAVYMIKRVVKRKRDPRVRGLARMRERETRYARRCSSVLQSLRYTGYLRKMLSSWSAR